MDRIASESFNCEYDIKNKHQKIANSHSTPQSYLQSDLDLFFANFSRNQVQKTPLLESIDGGKPTMNNPSYDTNAESDLDFEYAMSLVNPQEVTLYQVGDEIHKASFNNFLDAIDGSYCSFQGGDDKYLDAVYPDPFGGYQGPENCGGFAATKVISTSYDVNEADLTPKYERRQCLEYMKLGLQGVSVLYASGDYGVAGNFGECIGQDGNLTEPSAPDGKFNPSFPATCPYVTAVGATQLKPGASVFDPESACETIIHSGGGFSNVFPVPDCEFTSPNVSYLAPWVHTVSYYFSNYLSSSFFSSAMLTQYLHHRPNKRRQDILR